MCPCVSVCPWLTAAVVVHFTIANTISVIINQRDIDASCGEQSLHGLSLVVRSKLVIFLSLFGSLSHSENKYTLNGGCGGGVF